MERKGIIWRFGLLGILLYQFFYTREIWHKKGFVFLSFSLSFIVTFMIIGYLVLITTGNEMKWLIVIIALGILYGAWAQAYFKITR
ncbi:MAG: hypothetical protein RR554_09465 [Vagococcus sp.]|uniref:hypothetical protein n=1 Tax=Vagococcus sp. TaxID=1933889 RepID=UPI002FC8CB9D